MAGDNITVPQAKETSDWLRDKACSARSGHERGKGSAARTPARIEDRDQLAWHPAAEFLIVNLEIRVVWVLPAGIVQAAEFSEIVGELSGYFHLNSSNAAAALPAA